MNQHDWMAEQFEAHRQRLRTVAYRMLGSQSEADDAVQETWLRLSRAETSSVENLGGWLTTVVGRVCLDMLRSRKSRREHPLDTNVVEVAADPEHEVVMADSIGLALVVVLEALLALLDPEVVLRADAAAVHIGADEKIQGAREVARTFAGRARVAQPALVEGSPGLVWASAGKPKIAFAFTIAKGKIVAIEL